MQQPDGSSIIPGGGSLLAECLFDVLGEHMVVSLSIHQPPIRMSSYIYG
jgi:hypothetical protein